MTMRKMSWDEWKKEKTKEMESDPMFSFNKDVKPDKGLKADGFNDAIMGIVQRCGQDDVVLYDTDKVIEGLMKGDGMSYEEAVEYFEFNILGAWVGDGTPAFFSRASYEELKEEVGDDLGDLL